MIQTSHALSEGTSRARNPDEPLAVADHAAAKAAATKNALPYLTFHLAGWGMGAHHLRERGGCACSAISHGRPPAPGRASTPRRCPPTASAGARAEPCRARRGRPADRRWPERAERAAGLPRGSRLLAFQ